MKKANLSVLIFVIIVVGIIFFNRANNIVTGQTVGQSPTPALTPVVETTATPVSESTPAVTTAESTPTPNPEEVLPPTGGGEITTANTIVLNKNFTGIWKARVRRPETSSSSSSTGGSSTTTSSSTTSSTGGSSTTTSSSTSSTGGTDTTTSSSSTSSSGGADTTSSSSSSGGTTATRHAHITSDVIGSSIITFRLCVVDGELKGFVQQGGVLLMGEITSSTNISENEVHFEAESRDGRHATITLKLTGEREFTGTFADGHTFDGRKLNPRGCAGVAATIIGGSDRPGRPGRPEQSPTPLPDGVTPTTDNPEGNTLGSPGMGHGPKMDFGPPGMGPQGMFGGARIE